MFPSSSFPEFPPFPFAFFFPAGAACLLPLNQSQKEAVGLLRVCIRQPRVGLEAKFQLSASFALVIQDVPERAFSGCILLPQVERDVIP